MPSLVRPTLSASAPNAPAQSRVRSRQIIAADADRIIDLLTRGFPLRRRDYWVRALDTLGAHRPPPGMPQYGYLLETGEEIVGVILLVFSSIPGEAGPQIRCNISSWYVEPAFRGHASFLIAHATKRKDVTYVNISPALHTRRTITAQGFSCYTDGQFVAIPALTTHGPRGGAEVVEIDAALEVPFDDAERDLLVAHKSHGCIALWCVSGGQAHPFVLLPRSVKGLLPGAQLIYCRHVRDFVRLAAPLGRYLLSRGRTFVIIDADGPIPGLAGRYVANKSPKYFKGPDRPNFGDIAFTEAVMFGI